MQSIYLVTTEYLAENSQSVADDLAQLLDAYELGGECRLRDEFDRIFAHDSILKRYVDWQQTSVHGDNPQWLQARLQELRKDIE